MRWRHGDVVLDRIDRIPAGAEYVAGNVLAQGEATGHAHRFSGEAQLMRFAQERAESALYLRVVTARLTHEEHGTIELPRGRYRVTQKRQYTPDGWEAVRD